MNIYNIINSKALGKANSKDEIEFIVNGFVNGSVPDYQMAAYLMAVKIHSMTKEETYHLTDAMLKSGKQIDLTKINGICVDKHSTGGVGDSTTFIIAPIMACLGYKFAKMSGRGLGHTGGTLDKLDCIDGIKLDLPFAGFIQIVNRVGCCVMGQTSELVPADKLMYALRDVTATVESIPLIASSIMSKKLASGSSIILIDVKYGAGAFMKTPEDAIFLAELMTDIGHRAGKTVSCLVTCMDNPLGDYVGNSLELLDSIEVLNGKQSNLSKVALRLAEELLHCCGLNSDEAKQKLKGCIDSRKALLKLVEMVSAQGGDGSYIVNKDKLAASKNQIKILAKSDGYINYDTVKLGMANTMLGGGRILKTDTIDHFVGIKLEKSAGEKVAQGDNVATVFFNESCQFKRAETMLDEAITVGAYEEPGKLIYALVNNDGIKLL